MLSEQLGFTTSWKMLARDKGWVKPLLIIALVSWIPVFGKIVVLGYGLEWARLTAWGIDSAPKQSRIDLRKMLLTGCTAYLISLFMGLAIVALGEFVFGGVYSVACITSGATGIFSDGPLEVLLEDVIDGFVSIPLALLILVFNLLLETFILTAEMRSTLYDSFTAGWRIDRLVQMVVRDFGGFIHVCAISALGALINSVGDVLLAIAARIVAVRGVVGLTLSMLSTSSLMGAILRVGILPALGILVVGILVLFGLQVLEVALQLVTINATGQWFERFDVGRWGASGDKLPDGVPHTPKKDSAPEPPQSGQPAEDVQPSVDARDDVVDAPYETVEAEPTDSPVAQAAPEQAPAADGTSDADGAVASDSHQSPDSL